MRGILIDNTTNNLIVQNGSVAIGVIDGQVAEGVLRAMRGELKEIPLIGGDVETMRGGEVDMMWPGEVKKMMQACGLDVSRVELTDGIITLS